jgi:hypothetical protein
LSQSKSLTGGRPELILCQERSNYKKLYTIGYGGRNPERLVKVLKEENVPNEI